MVAERMDQVLRQEFAWGIDAPRCFFRKELLAYIPEMKMNSSTYRVTKQPHPAGAGAQSLVLLLAC